MWPKYTLFSVNFGVKFIACQLASDFMVTLFCGSCLLDYMYFKLMGVTKMFVHTSPLAY